MTIAPDPATTQPVEINTPQNFTPEEIATLTLISDTLLPAIEREHDPHGFFAQRPSDLNIAPQMAAAIEDVGHPDDVELLRLTLRLLEQSWFNALMSGIARPFAEMSQEQREKVLHSWRVSRLNLRRKTFQSLKRMTTFLFYGVTNETGRNPNWDALGYTPPPNPAPEEPISKIEPLDIREDTVLYTDVVIVGSGAGGGVVAGELAEAGHDVIVVEKGGYYAEPDFDGDELTSTRNMYENKGLVTSRDLAMMVMAGSTLGGGTTINWSASFRTPKFVLEEWEHDFGLTELNGPRYQEAMNTVTARLGVNVEESIPNRQNAILQAGAEKLGLAWDVIPRNASDCDDCGFCNYGCALGAKKSTLRTYLLDAHTKHGTRIAVNAQVEKVLIERGQATGIKAVVTDCDGYQHQLTVQANVVVVAAGSLNTPGVLMKSGLTNVNIGRHLHLHPVTFVYGLYEEPVRGWSGKMMSRYINAFRNQDGRGYGAILETAPIHPSLSSLVLPWEDPAYFKDTMAKIENLSGLIVLTRDRYGGRITLDKHGKMALYYSLHPYDRQHMVQGLVEGLRVLIEGGAQHIATSIEGLRTCTIGLDNIDEFIARVVEHNFAPNTYALLSAHQMSTARMADTPEWGAVKPTGETWEVKNLFVADGSVFPTASGVNPMITIMSVAHVIAGHINATL
jgi:choline dehydrogenase-like flavoprotein